MALPPRPIALSDTFSLAGYLPQRQELYRIRRRFRGPAFLPPSTTMTDPRRGADPPFLLSQPNVIFVPLPMLAPPLTYHNPLFLPRRLEFNLNDGPSQRSEPPYTICLRRVSFVVVFFGQHRTNRLFSVPLTSFSAFVTQRQFFAFSFWISSLCWSLLHRMRAITPLHHLVPPLPGYPPSIVVVVPHPSIFSSLLRLSSFKRCRRSSSRLAASSRLGSSDYAASIAGGRDGRLCSGTVMGCGEESTCPPAQLKLGLGCNFRHQCISPLCDPWHSSSSWVWYSSAPRAQTRISSLWSCALLNRHILSLRILSPSLTPSRSPARFPFL
jgi:hypothetical protein